MPIKSQRSVPIVLLFIRSLLLNIFAKQLTYIDENFSGIDFLKVWRCVYRCERTTFIFDKFVKIEFSCFHLFIHSVSQHKGVCKRQQTKPSRPETKGLNKINRCWLLLHCFTCWFLVLLKQTPVAASKTIGYSGAWNNRRQETRTKASMISANQHHFL